MAEVRKIICDVCGRDIETGYVIKQAARRRIRGGSATNENYRFDLCTDCFDRIARECKKDANADAARNGAVDPSAAK